MREKQLKLRANCLRLDEFFLDELESFGIFVWSEKIIKIYGFRVQNLSLGMF